MKYLPTGEMVEVVKIHSSEVLVETMYEGYDGDHLSGPMRVVSKADLRDKAPVELIDVEIRAKLAELEAVSLRLRNKRQEAAEAEREVSERLERLQRHKALEFLEDFLGGRVTHYAVFEYWDAYIETPGVSKGDRDSRWDASNVKLLTLYGDSKGQLDWRLSRYATGGNERSVIPCRSEQEARTVIEAWANAAWENDTMRVDERDRRISAAEKLGLFVQPSLIEARLRRRLAAVLADEAKAVAVLAEKRALLQAAESALAPKTPASGEPANA